ncbi:MAG: hypothetical protein WD002_01210 [Pseudomonadales bacterium]
MRTNNQCPVLTGLSNHCRGLILILGLTIAPLVQADNISAPLYRSDIFQSVDYDLRDHYAAGIERHHFGSAVKVIGWKTGKSAYFGRTRIAGKYALGLVFGDDKTVYGITHRGIRITRYF